MGSGVRVPASASVGSPAIVGFFVWVGVTLKGARKVRWQQKWQHLRLAADVATANPMQRWATQSIETEDQKEGTGRTWRAVAAASEKPAMSALEWTGVLLGRLGQPRAWPALAASTPLKDCNE